jgi:DNA-binding Lrp family transcriptional regulator
LGEIKNMVQILTLLKITLGKIDDVFAKLQELPFVKVIYYVTGKYDLALIIEGKTSDELHEFFMEELDNIEGIKTSTSHLIMKRWKKG